MYTGDQARLLRARSPQLCPNANVHLDTTNITGDRGGVFSWQYGITIDLPPTWPPAPDEPEISKLGTAIHECAHMKQFYNWGGTRTGPRGDSEARSAAVFVADSTTPPGRRPDGSRLVPLEHAADCAKELISLRALSDLRRLLQPRGVRRSGPALAEPAVLTGHRHRAGGPLVPRPDASGRNGSAAASVTCP